MKPTKIAVITCYKLPDYGRAVVLRTAFATNQDHDVIIIKNRYRGILRYPEVFLKTLWVQVQKRPDIFIVTFRGYEILPAILLIALGRPVILDELINPIEVVREHRKLYQGRWQEKAMTIWESLTGLYYFCLRRCRLVIADTSAHAAYSAKASRLSIDQYRVIPVGADERYFKPLKRQPIKPFTVLYYSTMVPLHGLEYVIQAAEKLKNNDNINFLLVGGGATAKHQIETAKQSGAHVTHRDWIEPAELPDIIAASGVCLGGPFGNTLQAQFIITGKTYQFLASQVPVLIGETKATKTDGHFIDKANCLIVPQADAQALSNCIVWASSHPHELTNIAKAGRFLYEQHFSQKVIGSQLDQLVKDLRV